MGSRATSEIRLPQRHKIVFLRWKDNVTIGQPIEMDGLPLRIVLRQGMISMGCSDIEPEVLEYVLEKYRQKFSANEIELQSGSHPC